MLKLVVSCDLNNSHTVAPAYAIIKGDSERALATSPADTMIKRTTERLMAMNFHVGRSSV